jgi:hypothetical protein
MGRVGPHPARCVHPSPSCGRGLHSLDAEDLAVSPRRTEARGRMTREEAARILRNEEHFPWYLLEEAKRVNPDEARAIEKEIADVLARMKRR